jgi:hypothetical protein
LTERARRKPSGPLDAATEGLYGGLSRLRGKRSFHPHGIGYSGRLSVVAQQPEYEGVPLLERRGEHRVVCRLSRASGVPEPVPDILGLALRIVDLHGRDRHQDFLLATGASPPVARHLLLPGVRGFFGQALSTLLPYRIGSRLRVLGARAAHGGSHAAPGSLDELREAFARNGLRFRLALAPLHGGWSAFAEMALDTQLDHEETERLAFTPWNTGGGFEPAGPFQESRRPAYRGSQRGRGVAPLPPAPAPSGR